jgi:transcriptional regulator with XRE-family HTH domain
MSLRDQILGKLNDKEYRDAFVSEFIFSRIPLKIRAMRDSLGMSQSELGRKAGIAQPWVSKLEDPNYGRLTISTLLRVASAFDVGLYVDFVPFSEILDRSSNLSPESFRVRPFDEEMRSGCFERPVGVSEPIAAPVPSRVVNIGDFMRGDAQRAASLDLTGPRFQGVLSFARSTGGGANEAILHRAS